MHFVIPHVSRRLNLDFKQAKDVAKVFDADGSGTIDYAEFVKFCETDDLSEAVQASKNVVEKKTYGSILKKKLSDDELEVRAFSTSFLWYGAFFLGS